MRCPLNPGNSTGASAVRARPPAIRAAKTSTVQAPAPGVGGSRRPELAHIVGADAHGTHETGLISVTPSGNAAHNCGMGYGAPLAASTLATIDHRLEQQEARETLIALTDHRASRVGALDHRSLRNVSREFVGFGMAPAADVILRDKPHAITLISVRRWRSSSRMPRMLVRTAHPVDRKLCVLQQALSDSPVPGGLPPAPR